MRDLNPEFFERVKLHGQPVANPAAVVTHGQARFTVLSDRLIRLEWSKTGHFEDRATFGFPTRYSETVPNFKVSQTEATLQLNTGRLQLSYKGGAFTPESLVIRLELNGVWQAWRPGQANPTNLRGTRRTLDGARGEATLQEGFNSRAGWALIDESHAIVFDAEGWPLARPATDAQDWYFFGYGHDYQAAVQDYVKFGGSVPLIPKFVLGNWWSRYWAYSEQDLRQLVTDFEKEAIPLDVLVIDMDWHTPDSWTGYTWNKELFPDPSAFLAWLHERGLRATLNLHPAEGVQKFEEVYSEFARAMGQDPSTGEPVKFQLSDKRFVQNYFELLHHRLEAQGVDFWWMDWQQGTKTELQGLDPLPWLNHLHFHDSARQGRRPMLFSRWGGAGAQRYHIGFSGDTFAEWDALRFLPFMTATAANIAYGWWSHDIGGHFGAVEPELFVRWVQFGAVSPCLRLHATKDPLAERRPWTFPEPYAQSAKIALQFRQQFVPYLYTMARLATESAISLCRPMYFEQPAEEAAYIARDQYYLGENIIAAPITTPADPTSGLASVTVWLPTGDWLDYQTGAQLTGPGWFELKGSLDYLPMLVKAGSLIPLAPPAPSVDKTPADQLILQLFAGERGEFRLYEDDGQTLAYQQGQFEWSNFRQRQTAADTLELEILPVEGCCEALPEKRRYILRLKGFQSSLQSAKLGETILTLNTAGEIELPFINKKESALVQLKFAGAYRAASGQTAPETLVHFIEYVRPEDVISQLGHVVIAAPGRAATVSWVLNLDGQRQEFRQTYSPSETALILITPFSWNSQIRPLQWEAHVEIAQPSGQTLHYDFISKPLLAAVSHWTLATFSQTETLSRAITKKYSQTPEQLSHLDWGYNIYVHDQIRGRYQSDEKLIAHARTHFRNPQEREVRIEFWTIADKPQLFLNGQAVALDPQQTARLSRTFAPGQPVQYSVPVTLPAGQNELLLETESLPQNWRWHVGAAIIGAKGEILTDLIFEE